jgi:hypothetical protein
VTSTQGFGPKQALKPAGKFPVFETAWVACRFLFRNWRAFAIAVLIPLLLSLAFDLWSNEWIESSEAGTFVVDFVLSIPETLFSVAWFQFCLAGPKRAIPRWFPSWTSHYWHFLGYTLAFNVFYTVIGLLSSFSEDPTVLGIVLAVMVLALYLTTRLSLIFPAISIGQSYGLSWSWRLTIGNGWRILLACWLVAMPMIILAFMVGVAAFFGLNAVLGSGVDATDFGAADSSFGWAFVVVQALIWESMGYVIMGICAVVTAIAYQFCTTVHQPGTGARAEA